MYAQLWHTVLRLASWLVVHNPGCRCIARSVSLRRQGWMVLKALEKWWFPQCVPASPGVRGWCKCYRSVVSQCRHWNDAGGLPYFRHPPQHQGKIEEVLEGCCKLPSTHFQNPGIDVRPTGFIYLEPGELPFYLAGGMGGQGGGVQWFMNFQQWLIPENVGLRGAGGWGVLSSELEGLLRQGGSHVLDEEESSLQQRYEWGQRWWVGTWTHTGVGVVANLLKNRFSSFANSRSPCALEAGRCSLSSVSFHTSFALLCPILASVFSLYSSFFLSSFWTAWVPHDPLPWPSSSC